MSFLARFSRLAAAFVAMAALSAALSREAFADESSTAEPASDAAFVESIRPTLVKFCGDCHAPEVDEHVRFLHAENVAGMGDSRSVWRSAVEQLRNRTMPPADETQQPSEEERLLLAGWIERTLEATACDCGESAAPVTARRLNRREYRNTVLELTGVDFPVEEVFPVDGSGGEGFDNNGETLFLGPLLMERFVEAAERIVNAAIVTAPRELDYSAEDFAPPVEGQVDEAAQVRRIDPKQELHVAAASFANTDYDVILKLRPVEGKTTAVLKIDGIAAERFDVGGDEDDRKAVESKTVLRLPRGDHVLSIRCGGERPLEIESLSLRERQEELTDERRNRHRELLGLDALAPVEKPHDEARRIVHGFLREAFRRPPEESEVDAYYAVFASAFDRGTPFEEAIKLPLRATLVSSHFLFRLEDGPASDAVQPITDHELAVRLSYFLWSSMPDERLFRLADEGKLHEDATLAAEVERMLDDPRSVRFVDDFVGQWLGTSEVGGRVAPDDELFREFFTQELLEDMRDEPARTFETLVRENGSVVDFVTGDWSVVNDRLARHYGLIEDDTKKAEGGKQKKDAGSAGEFHKVAFGDGRRGGALGMAAVHMATSYPNRTSPVLRGGWVLETLLGVRVPSPPPNVPELKVDRKRSKSVRESLAAHREAKTCAACHDLIDPLGFSLDHFDVLGRWRDEDGESKIDASASLPSGEKFEGLPGLKEILLARREEYVRHLTRKTLGYALGRSLEDGDDCTVQRIAQAVVADDDRVRTLIREVALSTPFRNVQTPPESAAHGDEAAPASEPTPAPTEEKSP